MRVSVVIYFDDGTGAVFKEQSDSWPEQINIQAENEDVMYTLHDEGSSGFKGFQLNSTPLNSAYKFYPPEGYPGIITKQASDAYGKFEPSIEINFKVVTDIPRIIWIGFDPACGEYATKFSIVQKAMGWQINVEDNDASVVGIPMGPLAVPTGTVLTLQIHEWSRSNASAKVVRISPYYRDTYTGKDLLEFLCSENLLDSNMSIQPGICEQYADISVYDRNNTLHACAYRDMLSEDHKVSIYAHDDSTQLDHILGTYYISDWDINGSDMRVGMSSIDISYIFDKINVPSIPIEDRTVDDMLKLFFSYAQDVSWKYLDTNTEQYCKSILTPNSWFRAGTLRELLGKICTLGMLRIYWSVSKFIVARCW